MQKDTQGSKRTRRSPLDVSDSTGRRPGGGAAAAGGFNFQAAVTAVALTRLAVGTPIGWLRGVANDIPMEVACETGRGGDDLRLTLVGGEKVDVQVKKGLQSGASLTDALSALATAIQTSDVDFAVLAVCQLSSRSIGGALAEDLARLGEQEDAEVRSLAKAFRDRLRQDGADIEAICSRLRVVTVHALDDGAADVTAARAELASLFAKRKEAAVAWTLLHREASAMIAGRGVRRASSIASLFKASGLALAGADSPATLVARLSAWAWAANDSFSILGVRKRLSIDDAWQPITLLVDPEGPAPEADAAQALRDYHTPRPRPGRRETHSCDGEALGRFYRHAVVIAGPGLGKSTLLRRLARQFSGEGRPVLLVRARAVAAAMKAGASFEAAVFELGLDGAGVAAETARTAPIDDWILLCDGLDEAGSSQDILADGLRQFRQGRPGACILTTSRPIGYRRHHLDDWRHYEIAGLNTDDLGRDLRRLLDQIQGPSSSKTDEGFSEFAERVIGDAGLRELVARSHLMIGIAAAIISRRQRIGRSRIDLFRTVFALVQEEPPVRAETAPATQEVLDRVLDLLGVQILENPLATSDLMVSAIGSTLSTELGCTPLQARATARACLTYWENLGLVETLRHDDQVMLTTTHLMFAEFCAGRFIAGLSLEDMTPFIVLRSSDPRWAEALIFAAADGAADHVVGGLLERGVEGEAGRDRLIRCLDIVAESRSVLELGLLDRLLRAAEEAMASDNVSLACEVALATAAIARRFPELVVPSVSRLLNAGFPWARLAAWSLVVQAGAGHYDLAAAQAALLDFIDSRNERPKLERGIVIGDPEDELLRLFAGDVIEAVLGERSLADAETFIEPILKTRGLNNYAFWLRIHAALAERGSRINPFKGIGFEGGLPDFKAYNDAARHAYASMLGALVDPSAVPPPPPPAPARKRAFFELAALSKYCGWGEGSLADVWVWSRPFEARAVAAALKGILLAGGLDAELVAREAAQVLLALEKPGADVISAFYARLLQVDAPGLNLVKLDRDRLDVEGLRLALRHPSEMVAPVAAQLLDAVLSEEERKDLVRELLREDTAMTAFVGTYLSRQLHDAEVVMLLLEGLSSTTLGAGDRLATLSLRRSPCDAAVLKALTPLLIGTDSDLAVEVAKYLESAAPLDETALREVRRAVTHWETAEKPYSVGGGTVPSSPRSRLLGILAAAGDLGFNALLTLTRDIRADVREGGAVALVRLLEQSVETRLEFAERAARGDVPVEAMKAVFASVVPLESEDILDRICGVFNHSDGRIRIAGMSLLRRASFPETRRAAWLATLRADVEPDIRAHAARLQVEGPGVVTASNPIGRRTSSRRRL